MATAILKFGQWHQPGQTQAANTAIKIPIPPFPGPPGNPPLIYAVDSQGSPNWTKPGAVTFVTNYSILTGSTAHTGYFMRPLNWSVVSVAGAANGTTFTVGTDPGLYTTAANWKWSSVAPVGVATNAIAANDYFAVQLVDGTWFFDKVSSVSSLAITTTTTIPNISGGGIAAGAVMFFFGIQTDLDPRQGVSPFGHPNIQPNVSVFTQFADPYGLVSTLGPGEPMYYFNANATAADTVAFMCGYYGKV